MTELLNWLNKNNNLLPENKNLASNHTLNLGLSIKPYLRLVYFEHNLKEKQYIGFEQYNIQQEKFYIIPPYELSYIPNTATEFYCIEMPLQALSRKKLMVLFSIIYTNKRIIEMDVAKLQLLQNMPYNNAINIVFSNLRKQHHTSITTQPIYLNYAEKLFNLLPHINFTHKTNTKEWAENIGIPPKTLLRACNAIFSIAPKYIIRYHLLSKCMYMLLHYPNENIATIADKLAFKDLTTFNRFLKTLSNKTPNEIKSMYAHLEI